MIKPTLIRWRARVARLPLHVTAPIVVALLSGLAAYWLALAYLQQSERRVAQRYAAQHEERTVLVAARALVAGSRIEPGELARRRVPAAYVPHAAYAPDAVAELYGRVLAHPLSAGEVVTPAVLAAGGSPGLSQLFDAGERAVTIAVDDTNSHAGLVRPGDLIDLLWLADASADPGDPLTVRTLLSAVRVLATGKTLRTMVRTTSVAEGSESPLVREFTTLTLRATPDGAARIAIAERAGELLITLRATDDSVPAEGARTTLAGLLGSDGATVAPMRRSLQHVDGWVGGRGGVGGAYRWTVGRADPGAAP